HLISFPLPRPRRHRDPDGREWLLPAGPKLKMRSERNAHTYIRLDDHDFLSAALLAPHFPTAGEEKPDLLDGPVGDRLRCLPRRQLKVSHAAGCQPQQETDV